MTAKESEGCRKASVDLVREAPVRLIRMFQSAKPAFQMSLSEWLPDTVRSGGAWKKDSITCLSMPRNVNWDTLRRVYEFQPSNYEELLGFRGIGPATVRGLALVAEIIYGQGACWRDPVKYSFAYGGKDGVPHPVDREAMDESIQILKQAVEASGIGDPEKTRSLRALMRFVPNPSRIMDA